MQLWPLDDTVFNEEIAERLAVECYRTHSPGPWARNGKTKELLEGLWWAEVGYWKGSMMDNGERAHRSLMAKLRPKKGFGTKLTAAADEWETFSNEERLYFAEVVKCTGEPRDRSEILREFDRVIQYCLLADYLLKTSGSGTGNRGPIAQLRGLKRFVERLRCVWDRNNLGEAFAAEFDKRVEGDGSLQPVSAAAKLVCASAVFLDAKYSPATCYAVMRPR